MQIFENFGIQPTLLLAQIVNFLIILFLLKKFFYKPIIKVLEDRKNRIEDSLKNADLISEKLAKTDEKSRLIIEGAQKNAQDLISDAKSEAGRILNQAQEDARAAGQEAIIQVRAQIENERVKMQKELEDQTLNLVIGVVKKVLSKTLSVKEKQTITKEAITHLAKEIK